MSGTCHCCSHVTTLFCKTFLRINILNLYHRVDLLNSFLILSVILMKCEINTEERKKEVKGTKGIKESKSNRRMITK